MLSQKICKIKSETRKLYAKSFFLNCLHAPKNKQEYDRDINYLFYGTSSKAKTELIGDTSRFLKFHKLDDNYYCQCADQIYSYYKNNSMLMPLIENDTLDKQFFCIYMMTLFMNWFMLLLLYMNLFLALRYLIHI